LRVTRILPRRKSGKIPGSQGPQAKTNFFAAILRGCAPEPRVATTSTSRRPEAVPNNRVQHGLIVPEGIDPGMQGEDLLCFMTAPDKDAHPRGDHVAKFPKHSALADAGLAAQQYHPPADIKHFRQRVIQASRLEFTADHRSFVNPSVYVSMQGSRALLLTIGTGTRATQDIAIDLPRLLLGLDAQFSLEPADALLILFQCRRSLPLTRQKSH